MSYFLNYVNSKTKQNELRNRVIHVKSFLSIALALRDKLRTSSDACSWSIKRDVNAIERNMQRGKLSCVKKKKKKSALFRVEILLRFWLSFEHKLRALHSLFYYSRLVPLCYKVFHIMCSCVINLIGAWCFREIFFWLRVMFKFYSHIDRDLS